MSWVNGTFTGGHASAFGTTGSLQAFDTLPQFLGNQTMEALNLAELQDLGLWATGLALLGIVPAILMIALLLTCIVMHAFCIENGELQTYNSDGELVTVDIQKVWTFTRYKPQAVCIITLFITMIYSFLSINAANPQYTANVSSDDGMLAIITDDLFANLISFGDELKAEINLVRDYVVNNGSNGSTPSNLTSYIDSVKAIYIGSDRIGADGWPNGLNTRHNEIADEMEKYCKSVNDMQFKAAGTTHKMKHVQNIWPYPRVPGVESCRDWKAEIDPPAQEYWLNISLIKSNMVPKLLYSQSKITNQTSELIESALYDVLADLEKYEAEIGPILKNVRTIDQSTGVAFQVVFGVPLLMLPVILIRKVFVFHLAYITTWCCTGMMFFLLGLYLGIGAITKGFCLYLDDVELAGFQLSWHNTTAEDIGIIIDVALSQEGLMDAIGVSEMLPTSLNLPMVVDHEKAFIFPLWEEHCALLEESTVNNAFTPPLQCPGAAEEHCIEADSILTDILDQRQVVLDKIEEIRLFGKETTSILYAVENEMEFFRERRDGIENIDRLTLLSDGYWKLKEVACNNLLDSSSLLLWHMYVEGCIGLLITFTLILFTRCYDVFIGFPLPDLPDDDSSEDLKKRKSKRKSTRKSMTGRKSVASRKSMVARKSMIARKSINPGKEGEKFEKSTSKNSDDGTKKGGKNLRKEGSASPTNYPNEEMKLRKSKFQTSHAFSPRSHYANWLDSIFSSRFPLCLCRNNGER